MLKKIVYSTLFAVVGLWIAWTGIIFYKFANSALQPKDIMVSVKSPDSLLTEWLALAFAGIFLIILTIMLNEQEGKK